MDDDEIAAMLEDLGHGRRDAVVAPETRTSGPFRNEYEKRLDAEEEFHIRQQQLKLNAPAENEKHAKLQQWNIATTFGVDEVAAQQEDRYGGQGHRASLVTALLKYNRNPDGSDAGHGGGGNRGGRGGRGGGAFRGNGGAMPQHFRPPPLPPPAPTPVNRRAPATPGRGRARSPRDKGVTKFVHGKAVAAIPQRVPRQNPPLGGGAQQAKNNIAKGPAAVAAAARLRNMAKDQDMASQQATALQQATESYVKGSESLQAVSKPTPAPAQAPRVVSPVLSTKSSEADASTAVSGTESLFARIRTSFAGITNRTDQLPTVPAKQTPTSNTPAPRLKEAAAAFAALRQPAALPVSAPGAHFALDQSTKTAVVANTPAKIRAIMAAETAGYDGARHDPQLLLEARQEIAKDVVRYAANPESKEASQYFAAHKHRAWLLQPAVDALHDASPDNMTDLTIQAIVEHAAILRQKAESLPSPPLSAERGRTTSRSVLSSLATSSLMRKIGGVISVDFYDAEGNHHKNERYEVTQPVNASVTVTSKTGEFDPMGMARQMEALAKRMVQNF